MKTSGMQNHTFFTTSTLSGVERYWFGFNSQEKEDEIYGEGNTYSAEYWMYDARLGRRWNLDPKPNPSLSWYSTFAGNPIWFSDPLGDTLRTDGTTASNNDIASIAGDYSNLVAFDENNKVYINYESAKKTFDTEEAFNNYVSQAKADAGIQLLNLLIESDKNFFYATTTTQPFIAYCPSGTFQAQYVQNDINQFSSIGDRLSGQDMYGVFKNLSTTPRGDEYGQLPTLGYDAEIYLAPGNFMIQSPNIRQGFLTQVPRQNVIVHELYESYFRTADPRRLSYNDAHKMAIRVYEQNKYNFSFNFPLLSGFVNDSGDSYNYFIRK